MFETGVNVTNLHGLWTCPILSSGKANEIIIKYRNKLLDGLFEYYLLEYSSHCNAEFLLQLLV